MSSVEAFVTGDQDFSSDSLILSHHQRRLEWRATTEQTTLLSHNLECHSPQATLATLPSHNLECHNRHHQLQEEVNEWGGG